MKTRLSFVADFRKEGWARQMDVSEDKICSEIFKVKIYNIQELLFFYF